MQVTKEIRTANIYGCGIHKHHAENAHKHGVISSNELDILSGAYKHCVFTGRRMSDDLAEAGDKINKKVHKFVLENDQIELGTFLAAALAQATEINYLDLSCTKPANGLFGYNDGKNGWRECAYSIEKDSVTLDF